MPRAPRKTKPAPVAPATDGGALAGGRPLADEVRELLRQARGKAYAAANFIMVETYWKIGRRIVEEEQQGQVRATYGSGLIRQLARDLGDEFGHGVSVANLKNFRHFYLVFKNLEIGYALRSQLTWTHYRLIIRVESEAARRYYIQEAADQNWSSRTLERMIATKSYERLLSTSTSSAPLIKAKDQASPLDFIKDPYVLEFLDLPDLPTLERPLEDALILRLRDFLMELGKGFSFVGRQFRVSTETSHFFIDLVFYNYLLKCFVLIDLKSGKLTHQDIGQMDMYVRIFDDLKRGHDDNPTLGIILCADKDDTLVRYSTLSENPQLFASKYRLVLPSEEELRDELERRHILQLPSETT